MYCVHNRMLFKKRLLDFTKLYLFRLRKHEASRRNLTKLSSLRKNEFQFRFILTLPTKLATFLSAKKFRWYVQATNINWKRSLDQRKIQSQWMKNLEITKFNVAQETVDIRTLDKLGGQSTPDSKNTRHLRTTTTLTSLLLRSHEILIKRWTEALCTQFAQTWFVCMFKNTKKRLMNDERQALGNI
jgi:hypothetical protein